MQRLVAIVTIIAGLTLSACATSPTRYGPAAMQRGAGFSEQRIEPDRYRVTFSGAGDPQRIHDLALRRAAELTMQQGYTWFRVVGGNGTSNRGNGPTMSVGVGTGNYGYRSGVSLGLGTSFNLGLPQSTTTLEILMGRATTPGEADYYDPQAVLANVRA